jgi:membrane protein
MNNLKDKIKAFFTEDVWALNLRELSGIRSFFIKQLRIVVLAVQGFLADKCSLRASALTFYSIFSIVPIAAMVFGIAKGFGYEQKLKAQLLERFADHEVVLEKIYAFADTTLREAKGGMIAGIGVAVLFWTVIKVIGNIEHSFNDIWGIKQHRTLYRKFSDYMSMLLILLLLLIITGGATVFVTTQLSRLSNAIPYFDVVGSPLTSLSVKAIPFILTWGLFTFIYKVMPNTKVSFNSALLAGVITGTAFQFLQMGFIIAQVALSKYNTIYGSFAALPLFLIWLQISWLVVLFGAEVSFAHQNIETYEFEPHSLEISYSYRKKLLLQVATMIVKSFEKHDTPLNDVEIAHACGIPIRQTRDILFALINAGVVAKVVNDKSDTIGFHPAVPINIISIQYVLEQVEACGTGKFPFPHTEDFDKISQNLNVINNTINSSPENKLLKDI